MFMLYMKKLKHEEVINFSEVTQIVSTLGADTGALAPELYS